MQKAFTARMFHNGDDAFSFGPSRSVAIGIVLLHALAIWALMQLDVVHNVVVQATPVFASIIEQQAKPQQEQAQPEPVQRTKMPPPPKDVLIAAPVDAPSTMVAAAPPVNESREVVEQAPPPAAPPTPPVKAVVAAGPKMIPPSGVQYLVPPQMEYPRAARRQRQAGRALVKVYIDEAGMPRTVELEKSTGFALLDEAAQAAVRKARFKPYTENGQAMPGWALIPLTFDLET